MRFPVYIHDITSMSALRRDGHPSVYRRADVSSDCSHWCLPGVPDIWNEMLSSML
ncbi:Protein trichome birefringence-like 36 [Linum perenne]